jgi:hypothetical protein
MYLPYEQGQWGRGEKQANGCGPCTVLFSISISLGVERLRSSKSLHLCLVNVIWWHGIRRGSEEKVDCINSTPSATCIGMNNQSLKLTMSSFTGRILCCENASDQAANVAAMSDIALSVSEAYH